MHVPYLQNAVEREAGKGQLQVAPREVTHEEGHKGQHNHGEGPQEGPHRALGKPVSGWQKLHAKNAAGQTSTLQKNK